MQMFHYNVCAGNKPSEFLKQLSAFWRSFCAAGEKSLRFNKTKRERERLEERSNFKDILASFLHRMQEADGFQPSWEVPPEEFRSRNYDVKCAQVNFVGNKWMRDVGLCFSRVRNACLFRSTKKENLNLQVEWKWSNAARENYGKCSFVAQAYWLSHLTTAKIDFLTLVFVPCFPVKNI